MGSERFRLLSKQLALPIVAALAITAALAWGIYENRQHAAYKAQLQNMYTRSFYELVDSVDNIEVKLSKLMVSNSQGNSTQLLTDISRQSESANDKLSQLPVNHPALSNTMGLITLTGDYCRSLALKAAEGHPLTEDDIKALRELYDSCMQISTELRDMQAEGRVDFSDLGQNGFYDMMGQNGMSTRFSEREKSGELLPTLIYDGPFSESLNQPAPKGLSGGKVDEATARAAAATFLGLTNTDGIAVNGISNVNMQAYELSAKNAAGAQVNLLVSLQGGKVVQMLEDAPPAQESLSLEECIQRSQQWLQSVGLPAMTPTFLQAYDGQLVINYAPVQDGAVLYPDLVKVKVSMGDGHVCAFDALGYWMNHTNRPVLAPQMQQEEARKLLSSQLEVTGTQLALIPTSGGGERLCWEYKGTSGSDSFIVYIDAITGVEAQIFKIVPTDNGNLVV